jgi:hypothetical protein
MYLWRLFERGGGWKGEEIVSYSDAGIYHQQDIATDDNEKKDTEG